MVTDERELRIPIVEEQLHVAKRTVERERVRVRTVLDTRDVLVNDTLDVEALEIERRAADRPVDAAPAPREEGGDLVISIVEERLVKQLFVVEEVVVRRVTTPEPITATVPLRRMRAVIERDDLTRQQEEH